MKAKTRIFGEIEIADDKIITLEKGMIGFPDLNRFALIFDEEKQKKHNSIIFRSPAPKRAGDYSFLMPIGSAWQPLKISIWRRKGQSIWILKKMPLYDKLGIYLPFAMFCDA